MAIADFWNVLLADLRSRFGRADHVYRQYVTDNEHEIGYGKQMLSKRLQGSRALRLVAVALSAAGLWLLILAAAATLQAT